MSLQHIYSGYDQSSEWMGVNPYEPAGLDRLWNPPVARIDDASEPRRRPPQAPREQREPREPREQPQAPQPQSRAQSLFSAPQKTATDPIMYWGLALGGLVLLDMYLRNSK